MQLKILILITFFLSGFSSLNFEIIWSKILSLIFGISIYGQSIILALFMGGLAIGSKIIGKKAKNSSDPFLLYALLEAIIACAGILSIFLFDIIKYVEINNNYLDYSIKIMICALIILPATISMGGTFPVIYKIYQILNEKYSNKLNSIKNISILYVANTLGALCGIACSIYLFIQYLGISVSLLLSAFINLLILLIFVIIKKYYKSLKIKSPVLSQNTPTQSLNKKPLIALALSGASTIIYELSWSRALYFSFGSSTYTFSLIVFSFILGLTLGVEWIKRKTDLNKKQIQALICDFQIMIIVSSSCFLFIVFAMPVITSFLFANFSHSFIKLHLCELTILILIITPVAFFIGASFPLLSVLVKDDLLPNESDIGTAYAYNTLGSIFGSLLSGFILIRFIGPFQTIWFTISIHIIIFCLISIDFKFKTLKNHFIVALISIIFVVFQFNLFTPLDILKGNYAKTYQKQDFYLPIYLKNNKFFLQQKNKRFKTSATPYSLIWNKHGLTSSVAVLKNNKNTRLVINGKTDASVGSFHNTDMPTQSLLAFLPLILSLKQQNGLVIGYGSGVTAGILAKYTNQVDCLEIEERVIEASPFFSHYNHQALHASNLKIIVQDARKFVRQTNQKYDYISSEPSNIWMSGVSNLFTKEYFIDCKNILNKNGIMVQWVHLYKLSINDFKVILKTFSQVFPDFQIWGSFNYGDIFLTGYNNTFKNQLSQDRFRIFFNTWCYINEYKQMGISDLKTLKQFIINTDTLSIKEEIQNTSIHTDKKPILEYLAAQNMFKSEIKPIYKFLESDSK